MVSALRLLLILRVLTGRGPGWRLRILLSIALFWLLIYSILK